MQQKQRAHVISLYAQDEFDLCHLLAMANFGYQNEFKVAKGEG